MSSITNCDTLFTKKSHELEWSISNFDPSSYKTGDFIESCKFPEKGELRQFFRLTFYPKGQDMRQTDCVSLYLKVKRNIRLYCQLVLCKDGVTIGDLKFFQLVSNDYGYQNFVNQHDIWKSDDMCKLLIRCKLTLVSRRDTRFENVRSLDSPPPPLTYLNYESCRELYCDVVLAVDDKTFPAHKIILATKSEPFSAMFRHPMKEKNTSRVELNGFSAHVVELALKFIYSNVLCTDIISSWKTAFDLLRFADMYLISPLKTACTQFLIDTICTENVLDILSAACITDLSQLRLSCVEHIRLNLHDLAKRDEWKLKVESLPPLGAELVGILVAQLVDS